MFEIVEMKVQFPTCHIKLRGKKNQTPHSTRGSRHFVPPSFASTTKTLKCYMAVIIYASMLFGSTMYTVIV
jgi:hypothetical protein